MSTAMSTIRDIPTPKKSDSAITTRFIDTPAAITEFIDLVLDLPTDPPSLYMDLEGVNLSRKGSISIAQIFIPQQKCVFLLDIHNLQSETFLTKGTSGTTLKEILEIDTVPKVFFDVRMDSDALHSNFGISLAGVKDLQIMEFGARDSYRPYVNGLTTCITRDAGLLMSERINCLKIKEKGVKLFSPDFGGSFEVFNARPLPEEIRLYCVQDVQYMPRLFQVYQDKLDASTAEKVQEATLKRVKESQTEAYSGPGKQQVYGPW